MKSVSISTIFLGIIGIILFSAWIALLSIVLIHDYKEEKKSCKVKKYDCNIFRH